jgi:hypothetical protein
MKNPRSSVTLFISLLFVLLIAAVSPTLAQDEKRDAERQRLAAVMSPNADVEEFRAEMIDYLTDWETALQRMERIPGISQELSKAGLGSVAALQHAKAGLAGVSTADLMRMRAIYAGFPEWREGPRAIDGVALKFLRGRIGMTKPLGPAPKVITEDTCPDISATPSFVDIAAAETVLIVAEGVMEALPTDALTIVAREAAVAARAAAQGGVLAARTLRNQYDLCHQLTQAQVQSIVDGAKTLIIANDNANTTLITTTLGDIKTEIINNDNANRTTIINNDNANTTTILNAITVAKNELRDLILRTQIEADLAEADNASYVGFYVTPTAQGGHLDLVRSIVIETIVKLAGPKAAQANALRLKGDDFKAAGNYKSAYQNYRMAYKTAVN